MGDSTQTIDCFSKKQHAIHVSILFGIQDPPKCSWHQAVCPWEYAPKLKKKSKRSSLTNDGPVGKNFKAVNDSSKKRNAAREKKKASKKRFIYHHEIGEYMREYREITRVLTSELKNCTCHGSYTMKDVEKMYETLPKMRRRDVKKAKVSASQTNASSSTAKDYVQDEVEDESRTTSSQSIQLHMMNKAAIRAEIQRGVFKQSDKGSLDEFVQQNLGRDFFMGDPRFDKKGSSFPVVKIMLPQTHDVRRVSRCGTDSPQKAIYMESPSPSRSMCHSNDLQRNHVDDTDSGNAGMFKAISPDDIPRTPTSSDAMGRRRKSSTLSAKVRDFRPFSRNGIANRVSKAIKEKQRKRALSDPSVSQNAAKQEIPWKVLCYLGYNSSMRKYLHDIYNPVDRKQTKSPLEPSSRRCFDSVSTFDGPAARENRAKQHQSLFQKPSNVGASRFLAGDNAGDRDENEPRILVEKYLNVCRQERPKIAILPKLDTVVKPKVMRKFIAS